jgi:MATE family multidrug resistance protein
MVNATAHATGSGWAEEARATFVLAWPLVIAQLAQMSLTTTDVVMMGWLGPESLAAGTLAGALLHPFEIAGFGMVMATAPLIAQAIGARQFRSVRRTTRQGLWISIMLCSLMVPVLWQAEWIFLSLGQMPETSRMAGEYLHAAVWMLYPALMTIVLRGLVSAHGQTSVVLVITVIGIFVNAFGNYVLMFGKFGFPRLELVGAGISTSIVASVMFALLLAYVLTHRRHKRYAILLRFWKPDWPRFLRILRLGSPIGLMLAAETSLFAIAAVLMGWLGTAELAAHAIALQLASLAFMVPLGLSHATTIRVGLAYGRGSRSDVGLAGWVSIILATGVMAVTCLIFWLLPGPLVHLFLDPQNPANSLPITLAVGYLGIAALFQLFDGAQVASAAALRGISDTTVPAVVAIFSYWGCGLPIAWYLGFVVEWRGLGVWLGLAAGLAFAAVVLIGRFALRERFAFGRNVPRPRQI